MPVQVINTEQVGLLESHFQPRYDSAFAWKSAVSAFQAIPGLIAFWPMSALRRDSNVDEVRDLAGGAYHLTSNNIPKFGYENLVPYGWFNGTTQYLSRADGGAADWADVLGTETKIIAAQRGLTIGGWFWIDASTAANQNLMAKTTGVGAARSYLMWYDDATTVPNFTICLGAGASTSVVGTAGTTGTVDFNTWYFWCGRFDPSTELKIWLNENTNTNVVAIPASINDTGAPFTIGANGVPALYLDGRASLCFLSMNAVSDAIIFSLFQQTRAMFGV